jgi:hypothetical protein
LFVTSLSALPSARAEKTPAGVVKASVRRRRSLGNEAVTADRAGAAGPIDMTVAAVPMAAARDAKRTVRMAGPNRDRGLRTLCLDIVAGDREPTPPPKPVRSAAEKEHF